MEEKKRKGYKTSKAQVEANKRYLMKNEEAKEKKKISNLKSNGKKFILEYAKLEELEDYEKFIEERKKLLKNCWHNQNIMIYLKHRKKDKKILNNK